MGKEYGRFYKPKKKKRIILRNIMVFAAAIAAGIFAGSTAADKLQAEVTEEVMKEPYVVVGDTDKYNEAVINPGPYGSFNIQEAVPAEDEDGKSEDIWMADFVDTRTHVNVKGIYVTSDGITKDFDRLLELVDSTELNAMVIDIKDDDGRLTFMMEGRLIDEFGTARGFISDIDKLVATCKEKDIYLIARVVAFKDPLITRTRPEFGIHHQDGTLYRDYSRLTWILPNNYEYLDYLIEVAAQCAEAGFDEVNFDYIRFPTEGNISDFDLGEHDEEYTKIDAITEAIKYLCENIKPMGVYVSADVFGGIITSTIDQKNVGQSYVEMSKYLDYICPMIYPSHYANGYYGIDYPDTEPYKMMYYALRDSVKVLSVIDGENGNKADVRPWLQDFTASWVKHHITYGKEEVRAQIEATYDAGYRQWLLWNAAMKYTEGALMTEEEADYAYANRPTPTPSPTPTIPPDATPTPKPDVGEYFESPWKNK